MENRSIRFVTSIAICPDQIVRAPVSELVDIVLHGSGASFGKLRVRPGNLEIQANRKLYGSTWGI